MKFYVCYKNLHANRFEDLRPSTKIKSLSYETSAKFKMCGLCKCRIFI